MGDLQRYIQGRAAEGTSAACVVSGQNQAWMAKRGRFMVSSCRSAAMAFPGGLCSLRSAA